MQVSTSWTPPAGTLGELIAAAKIRVDKLRPRRGGVTDLAASVGRPTSLIAALRRADVAVVAEVKRRSPSRGVINADLQAVDQAAAFVDGGAAGVSVLTEPLRFGGALEDLAAVHARVGAPLLRKDFLIDVLQLHETRALGASAALLIVRALEPGHLRELVDAANEIGLEPLVEAHTEAELELALAVGARLIGINNRDLETLQIDPTTTTRLIPHVPADVVAVAESGFSGRVDVVRAGDSGADAVLIGSALSTAPDPAAAVRALTGIPRSERGRPS